MVKTKKAISTHKPLNLNCSLSEKSLMCGSFNVQPTKENNYHLAIGDNYEKRIQTLQSNYEKRFPNLWANYCGSAGHVSQDAVKRYIQEQQGKDVFEYSVYGSPNQKIGNFTKQAKLTGWSR